MENKKLNLLGLNKKSTSRFDFVIDKNRLSKSKRSTSHFDSAIKYNIFSKSKRSTSHFDSAIKYNIFSKSKRSQHEMVGFVLIVLIVTIIGVVFLSLTIGRGDPVKHGSVDISHLLTSSMYYTSDCAVNFIPQYRDVQDLVKACYKTPHQKCLSKDGSEKNVCEVLNSTLNNIIIKSLKVSEESVNKAYKLSIYSEGGNDKVIPEVQRGIFKNCSSINGGSHEIYVSSLGSEKINIELEVCRG